MFAIVDMGGFQEKVEKGQSLRIPLQVADTGTTVIFETVLLVVDGDDVKVGTPTLSGASVEVKVLGHGKTDKIRSMKFKRRKRYRRTLGHRQDYTEVEVVRITA